EPVPSDREPAPELPGSPPGIRKGCFHRGERLPEVGAGDDPTLVPGGLYALGTDGFGRSDDRAALRRFFHVDAESIVLAALSRLARRGEIKPAQIQKAIQETMNAEG